MHQNLRSFYLDYCSGRLNKYTIQGRVEIVVPYYIVKVRGKSKVLWTYWVSMK